jgi:hypothetical protein
MKRRSTTETALHARALCGHENIPRAQHRHVAVALTNSRIAGTLTFSAPSRLG